LRPLTETTPKPLLTLAGKPMLQYHIERLVAAGITELVINVSWLGEQIEACCGDGARYGAHIHYSREPGAPLDTGGGVRRALPLLGEGPFLVVAGDIWCEYPFARLRELPPGMLGRLVVVPNPPQHPQGDFHRAADGRLNREGRGDPCTYAGIALLAPALFEGFEEAVFPLREPLRAAAARGVLGAERWHGDWEDVGTLERYAALDRRLSAPG
jgi:MurNAc alpha-1-phosphate uridylyltransferase